MENNEIDEDDKTLIRLNRPQVLTLVIIHMKITCIYSSRTV